MDLKQRYMAAKQKLFDKAYANLNSAQRAAVFMVRGPLLVLAGAGSGKTTVLVRRISFIIKYGDAYHSESIKGELSEERIRRLEEAAKLPVEDITANILPEFIENPCPPWQILAITFTNKAANEIKERLAREIGDATVASDIWAGTFHSVCMRILRKYHIEAGLGNNFSIYDTADTKSAVRSAMKDVGIDEKFFPVKTVMTHISYYKNNLMDPEHAALEAGIDYRLAQMAKIYAAYQKKLAAANAVDFDDIIMRTVKLLENYHEVREYYTSKFRYVCVDEYQDTNGAQFRLTDLLSSGTRNLMIVGDDDQSIYKFRGATIKNIRDFTKNYTDSRVIRLEQNYRSTKNILDAANGVISNNSGRLGKTLVTVRGDGEKVTLHLAEDQNAESKFIVDTINSLVARGKYKYRDFAILYRTNAQSQNIETTFAKSGVPHRVLGGQRFTDRKEIKDIIAYLNLINNPNDTERLLRIINEPRRQIGEKTLEAVEAISRELGISMFSVMERAGEFAALSRSAAKLIEFTGMINSLATLLDDGMRLDEFVNRVADATGYRAMLIAGGEEERDRLDNVAEFISWAIEFSKSVENPSLAGFLEENALISDIDRYDETADAAVLMTIHSAKGLEFPVVFLPGMEDGIFPGMQSIMEGGEEIEEERRLAYVAITRAKDALFLIHTKCRMLYGKTSFNPVSRFVTEIPQHLIVNSVPNFYGTTAPAQNMPKTYFSEKFGDTLTVNKPLHKPERNASELFKEGDIVSHMTFGRGEIISVKQMGADHLYEVIFDNVGTKKLMASYVKLKKLN